MPGNVYGSAAYGLGDSARWARNQQVAKAGAVGEKKTAALFDKIAAGSPSVFMHDLRIPIPGVEANIDHLVVSGNKILVVDSKMWKPGFYWTLFGHTRRGWKSFPYADKQTMRMAVNGLRTHLMLSPDHFPTPLVVVWSGAQQTRKTSLWAARMPSARLVRPDMLEWEVSYFAKKPADPALVARLVPLLSQRVRR